MVENQVIKRQSKKPRQHVVSRRWNDQKHRVGCSELFPVASVVKQLVIVNQFVITNMKMGIPEKDNVEK